MTPFRHLPALSFAALACALGATGSAHAQRFDRGYDYDPENRGERYDAEHHGLYFAAGLGGGLQLVALDDGQFGGQAEVRVGYSFGRFFQIYLDTDLSGSSHYGAAITASDVMVGLRYFLHADPTVGVYARVGLGVGIVSGLSAYYGDTGPATEYGIAESYALGMEFRLDKKWSLSPEIFYRRTNETQVARVDTIGLGILINFN